MSISFGYTLFADSFCISRSHFFRICLTPLFNTMYSSTTLSGRVYLRNLGVRNSVLQYGRLHYDKCCSSDKHLGWLVITFAHTSKNVFNSLNHIL